MKLFKKADYSDIIRPHLKKELENLETTVSITNPPQEIFDQFSSILNSNIALIPEKVIKTKYLAKWWNEDLSTARNECNNARRTLQNKKKKTKRRRNIKALDKEIRAHVKKFQDKVRQARRDYMEAILEEANTTNI